ncbi:MAG: sel1 repeat family protein [Pseudomonadota bacterium]
MQRRHKKITLMLTGLLLISVVALTGCSSSAEREALENNPETILKQAREAFFEEKYVQVFEMLFPLATNGNAQAQYTLGYLYANGLGVEKNDQQAMNWIQRAAAQGHKKALKALR